MAAAMTTECPSSATPRGCFLPPLPLAGEGAEPREAGGGSLRESQRRRQFVVVNAISPVEQLPQHVVHGLAVLRSRRRRVALRRLRRRGWIGGGRGGGKIGASGPPPLPQRCAS